MAKSQTKTTILVSIVFIAVFISSAMGVSKFFDPVPPAYRYYIQEFRGKEHPGLDLVGFSPLREDSNKDGHIDSIEGQPAIAAKNGKVVYADWDVYEEKIDMDTGRIVRKPLEKGEGSGYGKMVVIDHEDGTISLYAHLKEIHVNGGNTVRRMSAGDDKATVVGIIGNTGSSCGNQLHFEIREYSQPIR